MEYDDIQRFIPDWVTLLLQCRTSPEPKILESLFRTQVKRRQWMRQDMHDYERMHSNIPNKSYDWLRSRVLAVIKLYRIARNPNKLEKREPA